MHQMTTHYPVVTIRVEGLTLKEFFAQRIHDLEKSLLKCNPAVGHLILSSIQVNKNIQATLN